MPRKCKPGLPLEVCLECDEKDPIESRCVFQGKVLSVIEAEGIDEQLVAANELGSAKAIHRERLRLLNGLLVGWRNLSDESGEIVFGSDDADERLLNLLMPTEVVELVRRIQYANEMDPEEKKS